MMTVDYIFFLSSVWRCFFEFKGNHRNFVGFASSVSSFPSRTAHLLYKVRNTYGQAAGCCFKRQTVFSNRRWLPRLPRALMKEVCIYSLWSFSPFITPGAPACSLSTAAGLWFEELLESQDPSEPSIQMWWRIRTRPWWKGASVDIRLSSVSYAHVVPGKIASVMQTDFMAWATPVCLPFGHSHTMVPGSWGRAMRPRCPGRLWSLPKLRLISESISMGKLTRA